MLNTSAPLFSDNTFETEIKKQEAELYSRLYPLAAEDFVAHPDLSIFVQETVACFNSIQSQLTNLMGVISRHTHTVPPHTHTIPPHTHTSAAPGQPTSPNIGGYVTGPTPLSTNPPVESASITWSNSTLPRFNNSTGAITNTAGNKVITGVSKHGPMITGKRRMKDDPALYSQPLLPIIKGLKSF